jgi:hypothetical protein
MAYKKLLHGILLLIIPCAAAFPQDARLSYNLKPGKHYLLEMEITQNTTSESMNSEEISMYSRMKLDFRIDSTSPSGLIHLSVQYSNLLLSMLAPGLSVDLNSESGKSRILKDLIDSLQQTSFRAIMAPSGELQSVEGISSLFSSLESYPAKDTNELNVILNTLNEAYGPHAFNGIFNLFVAFYPNVQPIKNWTRDFTYYFNTKPVPMVNRYYLTKSAGETVIIQGMGMLNSRQEFTETISLGLVKSSVSGTQTYDYQVDRETGWLRKCVSRQRLLIETTIINSPYFPTGLEIPSYTETLFEVKGSIP